MMPYGYIRRGDNLKLIFLGWGSIALRVITGLFKSIYQLMCTISHIFFFTRASFLEGINGIRSNGNENVDKISIFADN